MTREMITAIDLFAGPLPGGWDCAAKALGLDPLGIEWDEAACKTREAAGLRTQQGDVSLYDPLDVGYDEGCAYDEPGSLDLLIASPPCPTFSSAGKGDGIADMALVYQLADAIAIEPTIDVHTAMPDEIWRDTRSRLVVEPLRWALQLEPRFLAWEQVPPVLPFWEYCATILRRKGWNVWTGKVEAERYGVPQTRERAILMADREGPVHPPRPTHQRYVKGEPQRHEVTLEGEVLPWVSMAEALGWTNVAEVRNYKALDPTAPRAPGGGPASPTFDPNERPSRTLTHRVGGWDLKFRNGNQENAAERDAGEPAPTVAFGHNSARIEWVMEKRDDNRRAREEGRDTGRRASEPAATLDSKSRSAIWTTERPSTSACGDPRISPPGYRGGPSDYDAEGNFIGERSTDNAVRVTLEEAAILQSFAPDYPFQGSKSKRFEQVGNAVPPLLARAILGALLAPALQAEKKAAA